MNIDCYFSSTHNISKILSEQILAAKKSIYLAMYTLTDRDLINALKAKQQSGVDILAIFDEAQLAKFSDIILELNNADIVFKTIGKEIARMHHKFLIIDDTKVITGSFNWTYQADKSNMENIILINQKDIAYEYSEEFNRIWLRITEKGIDVYLKDSVKDKNKFQKEPVIENIDLFIDSIKKDWLNEPIEELRRKTYDKILDLEKRSEYSKAIRLIDWWLTMIVDSDFKKLRHELFP